jgi:glutathione S-transferase
MTLILYTLCAADRSRTFSPHAWKAVMALRHKDLDFEERPTRFTDIPAIEGGVTKTVPVLRDGDRVVVDSFAIAEHLETAYPDRPSLFGGEGGRAAARLIEAWSQTQLHTVITRIAARDIWTLLDEGDQAYFRPTREKRLGATLEEVEAVRAEQADLLCTRLEPLRVMLARQPFIGGEAPLFTDYIVFGALQWLRTTGTVWPLEEGDAVSDWFGRCLDLHGGAARAVPARASGNEAA